MLYRIIAFGGKKMKRVNKFLSVFLALIMIFSIIPMSTVTASAEDVATSGTCGENVYWDFDESTGTLTISGTGEMEASIPWKVFEPEITRVVFEEGVTSVASLAFLNEDGDLSNLKEVELSNTVTYIGGSAFNMCDGLTSIIIPDSVTMIEYDAFSQCVGLTKATVGNGTTRIGMGAFYGCENLKTVELGENLEQIGWNAFSSCTSLINIYIPAKVSKISDSFINCTSLKNFSVDTKNEYFSNDESGALLNKKQTHLLYYPVGSARGVYRFPKTVETIGYAAFNFSKLKQVILSENLKEIGSYSFAGCTELESVFMHDNITNIYSNAFNDCASLNDIYYFGSEEKWNEIEIDSENDCLLNATIHFNQREYNVTDTVSSSISFKFRADGGFNKFTGVKVDGEFVDSSNYTATEGSTIIEFKADYLETLDAGEHTVTVLFTDGIATTNFEIENFVFSVQSPSRTEIRNKDGIILHAVVDGTAPTDSYVKWESSNGNFDEDADGSKLEIIAKNKGYTTFTAILCDADGNELARDSVEMYSKSGFFDKIGGFFRSLFGITKIYDK